MPIEWGRPVKEESPAKAGEDLFCVNCKHHIVDKDGDNMCTRENGKQLDLVTGKWKSDDACFCSDERDEDDEDYCGTMARYFEPK